MAAELVARLSNLSPHVTQAHLTKLLQDHMQIKEIHMPAPRLWLSCPTGRAEVIGASEEDTARVYVYLHGAAIDGQRVFVQLVRVDPTLPPVDAYTAANDEGHAVTTSAIESAGQPPTRTTAAAAQGERESREGGRRARASRSRSYKRHRRSSSPPSSRRGHGEAGHSRSHHRRHRERSRYEGRRHASRSRSSSGASSRRRHRSRHRGRGHHEGHRDREEAVSATRSVSHTLQPVSKTATRSPSPEWD